MPRPRKSVPPVEIKVNLPADLSASVDMLLWDPVAKKPKYGARSELITGLLRKFVAEHTTSDGSPLASADEILISITNTGA